MAPTDRAGAGEGRPRRAGARAALWPPLAAHRGEPSHVFFCLLPKCDVDADSALQLAATAASRKRRTPASVLPIVSTTTHKKVPLLSRCSVARASPAASLPQPTLSDARGARSSVALEELSSFEEFAAQLENLELPNQLAAVLSNRFLQHTLALDASRTADGSASRCGPSVA